MAQKEPWQDAVGSPVKEFVRQFLKEAEEGISESGFIPCSESDSHVKVDLSAVEVKEKEGGVRIKIFSFGGQKSDSNAQRMTIFAKKLDDVERARRESEIAKHKKEKQDSERKPWIA